MKLRSRAIARGRISLVASMLLAPVAALAQTPRAPADVLPIPAGPFQLYPLFSAVVEQTDNLFLTGLDPVSATVTSVTPGISAEVPLRGDGQLYVGYALRYRDYGGADIDDNLSHFFLAGGDLDFGNGLVLALEEDYARGVLDTSTFDDGGEVVFRGDEFASNRTSVALSHENVARPSVGISVERDAVEFGKSVQPNLYNSEYYNVDLYGENRLGSQGGLRFGVYASEGDLIAVDDVEDRRDERTFRLTLGARWRLSPASSIAADFGWGKAKFFSDLSDQATESRNLVGSVNFVRFVPARARFAARISQGVFPSVFGNNAFYVSRGLFVQLENDPRARLSLGGSLTYTQNDYPEAEPQRTDDILGGRVWLGYRFGSAVEWRVFADIDSRSSIEPSLDYDANTFGVVLSLGG